MQRDIVRAWVNKNQRRPFFLILAMAIINFVLALTTLLIYDQTPRLNLDFNGEMVYVFYTTLYFFFSFFLLGISFVYYALEQQLKVSLRPLFVQIHLFTTLIFIIILYVLPILTGGEQSNISPSVTNSIIGFGSISFLIGQILFIGNVFGAIFRFILGRNRS